jgi:hypothetical protein
MDMRFETWNVRSLYRPGSLKIVLRELANYKLHLLGVQEVRWDEGSTEPADDYTFFYGNGNVYPADDYTFFYGNRNVYHHLETSFPYTR